MSESANTAGKVQIEPEELRKIFSSQFRSEVTETVWTRLKSTLTFGGALSFSVLVALGAAGLKWLDGNVQGTVTTELSRRIPQLSAEITAVAQREAQSAVQRDIANVQEVRQRVADRLPEILRTALDDPAIRAIIQRQSNEQTERQLKDPVWRRGIERSVMAQQAGDVSLPPLVRLFAFTDLLRDAEGEVTAIRLLADSAARVPDRGLASDDEEARFLSQAISTYVGHLSRGDTGDRFPTHEALIRRVAELVPEPAQPDNAFEALSRRFSSPIAINFLVRRARETTGAQRDVALQALLVHPSQEARERVESLLCGVDSRLRTDLVLASAMRAGTLSGDEAGQHFAHLVRCTEDVILAQRVPRVDIDCLPSGDLSSLWRYSRFFGDRVTPAARQAAQAMERAWAECPAAEPVVAAGGAALRAPLGWSTLLAVPSRAGRGAPLLGLVALLPPGQDAAAPRWLSDLAAGSGEMAAILDAPDRHLAHISLLIERLSLLPEEMEGLPAARQRVATALARVPAAPGRPSERLLLEMMTGGGARLCASVLASLAEAPAINPATAPLAALSESLACLRGTRALAAEYQGLALSVIRKLVASTDAEAARRSLGMIAAALGMEGSDSRAPAMLAGWIIGLPAGVEDGAVAGTLQDLIELEGLSLLAGVFERPGATEPLRRVQRQLAEKPAALAPVAAVAPYLNPAFRDRVAAAASPLAEGGRFWTLLQVPAAAGMLLGNDPSLVLLRPQPLAILPFELNGGQAETDVLNVGTYLVGAGRAEALAGFRPRPLPPETTGLLAIAAAAPVPLGGTIRSRLETDGARLYPFELSAGPLYEFTTLHLQADLDTTIELLDPSGQPLPDASNDDYGRGYASRLCLSVPGNGVYWLRVDNYGRPPPRPLGFELRAATVASCDAAR